MEEFFKDNYSFLTHSVEILAAVIGLFCLKKYKGTAARFFIYFLVYVVFVEQAGTYTKIIKDSSNPDLLKGSLIERNFWWYTLMWSLGSSIFFLYFYKKILKNSLYKKILSYMLWGFIAVFVIKYTTDYKALFENRSFLIVCLNLISVLICVLFYFMEILRSDKILEFHKSVYFYISAAILFWFLVSTPLSFFNKYFNTSDWNFIILKWQIMLFTNVIMYLTFSFALLWCKSPSKQ